MGKMGLKKGFAIAKLTIITDMDNTRIIIYSISNFRICFYFLNYLVDFDNYYCSKFEFVRNISSTHILSMIILRSLWKTVNKKIITNEFTFITRVYTFIAF